MRSGADEFILSEYGEIQETYEFIDVFRRSSFEFEQVCKYDTVIKPC